MKTYLECIPCFVRQAIEAAAMAGTDDDVQERIVRRALTAAAEFPFDQPPPIMAERIHAIVGEECNGVDPYRDAKRLSNDMALRLLEALRPRVESAADPFAAAVRLAAAANIIDMGAKTTRELGEQAVRAELGRTLEEPLCEGSLQALRRAVDAAQSILYITDNAGEIAFDRLLIEHMRPGAVTAVVRGENILNDATMDDAQAVGLTDVAHVWIGGGAVPGTLLSKCPSRVQEMFAGADVVISKGQGNYETLSGEARPNLFFLLRVKCPVIARDAGRQVGELVVGPGRGGVRPLP